jgi:ammonium transporter, Amt family
MRLLATVGFTVREAVDGAEAIAIRREWRPHLVWMDVRMPVMDGLAATKAIRELEAQSASTGAHSRSSDPARTRADRTRIVALTASVFDHECAAMLGAGADDLVVKPFRESTIFEKLAEQLGVSFEFEPSTNEIDSSDDGPLSTERIRALPEAIVDTLHTALFLGDREAALGTLPTIRAFDEQLADALAQKIHGFEFNDLLPLAERHA